MSHSQVMTEIGIPRTTLNLLRNDLMKFSCGPMVYRTIIDWGFAKPDGIKIIDHIKYMKIEEKITKKNFPKWLKDNKSKLDNDSFSDFDITALHDFLPILCCNKIAQTGGGKEYDERMKDPKSVESLLKKIKAFRNDVSHEFALAVDNSHIDETKQTMRECIRSAGRLYGKDQTEIDEKVKLLDDEFDKVLLDTTHLYENRVKYIGKFIETEVPAMLLDRYSPYFSVPLPCSSKKIDTSDIFQCSNLSVTTEDKERDIKASKTVFPCSEIYNNTHEKFVVINGGPGSGKTTLMKNLCQDILETSVNGSTPRYGKIEQLKIPIYLECRYEQETNLAKFLRECLKDFLSPEDDIIEAFKIVKGLVFLIDGYDEINNNCRQLVDRIIPFCRDNNASCIVSSRVDAGDNFASELEERNLNFTKMFIEPISEKSDKVNFLKSYAGKMDGSIETDKLMKSFADITTAAQEVFSSPILLALFISLFVQDPDSLSKMKNEHSVYEAVRTNFLREMERKLRNSSYAIGRAEDVTNVLGKYCLRLFEVKKYFLNRKEYLKMVAECEKIEGLPDNVDIHSLLSCILTPEHSFKYNQDTSYQFFHSTIQEFFAAKYVSENLRELQDDKSSRNQLESSFISNMKKSIALKLKKHTRLFQDDRSSHRQSEDIKLSELLQALKLKKTQWGIKNEMKRYGNIIKFLMLETLNNGEMSNYSNTFTILLKKYYKPKYFYNSYFSPVYYFDLILSSDNNSEIISIVSDCMKVLGNYKLNYYRHIKPMKEVVQTMKTGVKIEFSSEEVTNTQPIIKLLQVLEDNSEIELILSYSYYKYQPLEGEFYTQLKNSKCIVTKFMACISSEEHLSIVVKAFRGDKYDHLAINTPSVSNFSFAALEEFKGRLYLNVKYSEDFSLTGSNPVRGRTNLRIEHIPADGKDNLYNLIKYICPKSKEFDKLFLSHCQLTDTNANELLKKLHGEKIREREWGERTKVMQHRVNQDESRDLLFYLKEAKPEGRVERYVNSFPSSY